MKLWVDGEMTAVPLVTWSKQLAWKPHWATCLTCYEYIDEKAIVVAPVA